MTTLATDTPRVYEGGDRNELPVVASDIVHEGAAVGDNGSGYARPLQAGDPFRGFAEAKADNSSGSAGDRRVRVRRHGVVQLPISGLAITDVGKDVYASDDDTFTLTQGSNTRIGHVMRWVSSGVGMVAFQENVSDIAELTENASAIGGTQDGDFDTLAVAWDGAINPTAAEGTLLIDAIRECAAKINDLARRLGR